MIALLQVLKAGTFTVMSNSECREKSEQVRQQTQEGLETYV